MAGRLIVIDPGMAASSGHHIGLAGVIGHAAVALGWQPFVFGYLNA